jgi:hypothetical protein
VYCFHSSVTLLNCCSETISVQTFHFVQTQLENCYDMLTSDKKKMLLWSRRMHLALKAYQVRKNLCLGEGKHLSGNLAVNLQVPEQVGDSSCR